MKSMIFVIVAIAAFATASFAETPAAQEVTPAGKYPLMTCPVSGETLGEMGDPVVRVYEGREVKFCCEKCVETFEKDQAASMEKLDKAIIASQKASYALKTCPVSGEALGGMGDPLEYVYLNRLVEFCCGGCIKAFKKDPEKYLAMIDAATVETPAPEEKHE